MASCTSNGLELKNATQKEKYKTVESVPFQRQEMGERLIVPFGHCPEPANIVGGSKVLSPVTMLKNLFVTPTFPCSEEEREMKSYLTRFVKESKKKVNIVPGISESSKDHFSQIP